MPNKLETAEIAETELAAEEPSPADSGISLVIFRDTPLKEWSFRNCFREKAAGAKNPYASSIFALITLFSLTDDIILLSDLSALASTPMSRATASALEPCTTKCSPNNIALPGAFATA